jgi:predicted NBD/HSP70 family sugar kinase/mannose-6-phosphate isomerase class I
MSKHTNVKNPDERKLHGVEAGEAKGPDGGAAGGMHLGVDIGGTHITAALVRDGALLPETLRRAAIDPADNAVTLLDDWAGLINAVLSLAAGTVKSIGLAMPGPFDYPNGISMIRGLDKYESLYGLNIREGLRGRLTQKDLPIAFENDAACFGLGEARTGSARGHKKIIAITLGTGFGACFIDNKNLVTTGAGVPANGYLYNIPFKDGIAEDAISARGLLKAYPAKDVRAIAEKARIHEAAAKAFASFGGDLGLFLAPWLKAFEADALVIGGSISQSYALFAPTMQAAFQHKGVEVAVVVSENTEHIAIAGAASLTTMPTESIPARKSMQALLPKRLAAGQTSQHPNQPDGASHTNAGAGQSGQPTAASPAAYNIYPAEPLGTGQIAEGYTTLARWIIRQKQARIDGYAGIDWSLVRTNLSAALRLEGAQVLWFETSAWLKPETEIDALIQPFLGEPGSVWGTKTTLELKDLFSATLPEWTPPTDGDAIVILAGPGAGLSNWQTPIIYFDLPKNELQYRMRAGSATNLGGKTTGPNAEMYKRSYFVDWPFLNQHRRAIGKDIAIVADGQHDDNPNWAPMDAIRQGMRHMACNLIRARPWFEPGVWGGQWMKQHFPALSRDEINYAWSFELIAPENGIAFESDGLLLEIAFDWLMECESKAILGVDADRFKEEFPIRFDFLDTFGGGNLSIQCHPSLPYIKKHFGENITQDETYYILDCKPGAGVYLGFNEDIDPTAFKATLEKSQAANQAIDIEEYVQLLPAKKHDLFLIPNKTIHGAGVNNLVLEISATPYIYTFKMYDWMRLDLEGMPRPINIAHAFHNLDFARKGAKVQQELVSKPRLLQKDANMQLELLPTHPEHFYSIHRIILTGSTTIATEGRCHLLMLVEGKVLSIQTRQGRTYTLHYAETFVLPAAAGEYTLTNDETTPVTIIKSFIK